MRCVSTVKNKKRENMLELKIPPVIVLAVFAGIIIGIPFVISFYAVQSIWLIAFFILLGVIIALSGVWEFRKSKTTVNPTTSEKSSQIVNTGIYRFSRNPMYLGMALGLVGLTFAFGNLFSWLGVIGFVIYITHFQIIPEEKILKEIFGKNYTDYLNQVRRWI
ncbi:membrane protein [Capnocytophaga catalasegens]|uniref:Membrane protein n=2 Tax=Capnocytophaga catalasegens TaxID=1004260 RepID=A0AAV5AYT9_9FLAO|nr:membrane protein [Capnocytophaga catalasegens]GJM50635.1 membrane protein [Capnocytophaga catalasegens]GJM53372.1 membrane protein [Capnocytophaga catalasegens]